MTMRLILFRTIHGSHLYGTAHANSDNDTFTVYANEPRTRARWAKQHVGEDEDTLKTDLSTFMQYCDKGVPQYLEALWSTMAEIDLIKDLRSDFLPDTTRRCQPTSEPSRASMRGAWRNPTLSSPGMQPDSTSISRPSRHTAGSILPSPTRRS